MTIIDATNELRTKSGLEKDDILDIGVSCDGRCRGFWSLNGMV